MKDIQELQKNWKALLTDGVKVSFATAYTSFALS